MGASVFGIYEGPASSLGARIDSLWVASKLRGLSSDGLAEAHWRASRAHLTWGSRASARRHLAELRALNADQLKQAHYRLSLLYEEVREDAESLKHARLFEELLAEADAPYRPALDANRARIRRLRGAGR